MTFDDPKRAVRPVRILNRFHFQMNNLCSVCQAMLIPQGNGVLVSVRPAMMGACALNRALTPDFWCLTGFLCHHLACQRPIRFALQSQCERIPRSWHGFWRCSQPFAMFMWDGDGWQEPERNLNGGSFNGTQQGQIPLVRLVRPSARGSISCAFIRMCSLTYICLSTRRGSPSIRAKRKGSVLLRGWYKSICGSSCRLPWVRDWFG